MRRGVSATGLYYIGERIVAERRLSIWGETEMTKGERKPTFRNSNEKVDSGT